MTEPRYFSAIQRIELFSRSGGNCQSCGVPITLTEFHADHIIPHSKGGHEEWTRALSEVSSQ